MYNAFQQNRYISQIAHQAGLGHVVTKFILGMTLTIDATSVWVGTDINLNYLSM